MPVFSLHLHKTYIHVSAYILLSVFVCNVMQLFGLMWCTLKTVKPAIPTLSAIRHFKWPVNLQPHKVYRPLS